MSSGWQVPGLREELVTELIRSLPKQLRTAFVPVPDTARAVVARLGPVHGDLLDALGAELGRIGGVKIPRDAWDLSRLPAHLRMTFRVLDGDRVLASGKDLDALRRQLRPRLEAALSDAASGITRTGLTDWTFGTLPRVFRHGQVRAYPALADAGNTVDVRLFPTEAEASDAMRRGTRRLLLLQVPSGVRSIAGRLPPQAKLALSSHPYPSASALLDDCAACAADAVIGESGGPAWDAAGFARLVDAARSSLAVTTAEVVEVVARRPRGGARGPDQAGAGRRPGGGARRHARPVLRAGLLRVHRRDRAGPAARPGPLPQGHHPQAGQDARVSRARRGADGGRAPGHGRLRAGPGRAWSSRPGPAPPRPLSAG